MKVSEGESGDNGIASKLIILLLRQRIQEELQQEVPGEHDGRIRVRLPLDNALRSNVLQQEQAEQHDHGEEEVFEEEWGGHGDATRGITEHRSTGGTDQVRLPEGERFVRVSVAPNEVLPHLPDHGIVKGKEGLVIKSRRDDSILG